MKTPPDQNKVLLLEAFDTLFNKRDYEAAVRRASRGPRRVVISPMWPKLSCGLRAYFNCRHREALFGASQ
jgi:hypothetical protein